MDDNDFINDPLFSSLRKFSSSPDNSQIMSTSIRNAFRNGIKSSKKRRFVWRGAIGAGLMVIAFPTFAAAKILPAPFQHIIENINRVITSPVHILIDSVAPPKKAVAKNEKIGNDGNSGIVGNVVEGTGDLGNFDLNSALGAIQGNENNQENQNSNDESKVTPTPTRTSKPFANQENNASPGDSSNENQKANQEDGQSNVDVPNSLPTLTNNLIPITGDSGISGSSILSPTNSQSSQQPVEQPQISGTQNSNNVSGKDNEDSNANN